MNNAAVIQVRMDSSRFPSKASALILEKPLLWHVIERSKKIGIPVILATTSRDIDDPIVEIAKNCNVEIFRGSYKNVLERFYETAKKFSIENIFRISADTPLIDPRLCSKMVKIFQSGEYDYIRFDYNTVGIGMEGFTFSTLENAYHNVCTDEEKEHVTIFMKNPLNNFKLKVIDTNYDLGKYDWTVETKEDLKFVNNLFKEFKNNENFYVEDVLNLIKEKPHLSKTQ